MHAAGILQPALCRRHTPARFPRRAAARRRARGRDTRSTSWCSPRPARSASSASSSRPRSAASRRRARRAPPCAASDLVRMRRDLLFSRGGLVGRADVSADSGQPARNQLPQPAAPRPPPGDAWSRTRLPPLRRSAASRSTCSIGMRSNSPKPDALQVVDERVGVADEHDRQAIRAGNSCARRAGRRPASRCCTRSREGLQLLERQLVEQLIQHLRRDRVGRLDGQREVADQVGLRALELAVVDALALQLEELVDDQRAALRPCASVRVSVSATMPPAVL